MEDRLELERRTVRELRTRYRQLASMSGADTAAWYEAQRRTLDVVNSTPDPESTLRDMRLAAL